MLKIRISFHEVDEKSGIETLVTGNGTGSDTVLDAEAELARLARVYQTWHSEMSCNVSDCNEIATMTTESDDQYCEKHGQEREAQGLLNTKGD